MKRIIWLVVVLLVGCRTAVSTPIPTLETIAIAPTSTVTLVPPTSTPILTPSPSSTSTATSTAMETPYAIPTPPGEKFVEQVLWLYETNNGCQLPCWWGIAPGQTEWQVARKLLSRFDQDIYQDTSTNGEIYYEVNIPLPLEIFAEDRTNLAILVQNGIVEIIDTHVSIGDTPPDHLSQYTLSTFLSTYGQPSEIWLSTYSAPFEHNDLPFRILLFYSEKGIMALYSDNGVKEGEIVQGCPQKDPVSALSLWSPTLDLTFQEVKSGFAVYNVDYLPLQETTQMNIAAFYETFKNPDNTICLETQAELWRYIK